MLYTRDLLNHDSLDQIKDIIPHLEWEDGSYSVIGDMRKNKHNVEAVNSPALERIETIIMDSLDEDVAFLSKTQASSSTNIIISKMGYDGFYNVHQDHWHLGDYSTSVCLTSSEYSGGELEIDGQLIKLKAGEAVTYDTGLPHRVNRVSSGERIVAVFWTHSHIRDRLVREVCSKLGDACNLMEYSSPVSVEDAKKDPFYLVQSSLMDLQRRYRR